MNQWQPGEGGMCMALVQERPSESSAGNPGCLSEHKCECVKVCASAQEGGRCSNCRTIWVCIILQTVCNGLPLHMYGETLLTQSLYCYCQYMRSSYSVSISARSQALLTRQPQWQHADEIKLSAVLLWDASSKFLSSYRMQRSICRQRFHLQMGSYYNQQEGDLGP